MLYQTFNIFVLLIFVLFVTKSWTQDSFSANKQDLINEINGMFGVPVNYVFNQLTVYPPIHEDVTFWGISSGDSNFTQLFINDSNVASQIDLTTPILILTHGWMDAFRAGYGQGNIYGWMEPTARDWLKYRQQTVICIDWNRLANYVYPITAAVNTKLVGEFAGKFISFLQKLGVSLDNIIFAGHSLGAHIAGYAGKYNNGQLGQIIGLDPAGPLYTVPVDIGVAFRLDPKDAKYVQVIHTTCGTYGVQINCGHADFYANGGAIQPGCVLPTIFDVESNSDDTIICSHSRSFEIFQSSINPKNKFIGHQCSGNFIGCNIVQSTVTAIPIIGTTLLNPIAGSVNCPYTASGITDLFGVYNGKLNGTFDLRTTKTSAPYV